MQDPESLLANRQVLVCYDVLGPTLWHERLVLHYITNDDYVVACLDSEVFYEELSLLNPDFEGIRLKLGSNVLLPGINAGEVYPLPMSTAGQLTALRAEATRILEQEKRQRLVEARDNISQSQFVAGTLCWVAAECLGDIKYGDQIPGITIISVKGAKASPCIGRWDMHIC